VCLDVFVHGLAALLKRGILAKLKKGFAPFCNSLFCSFCLIDFQPEKGYDSFRQPLPF
jgi:hypothetical protein